MKVCAHVKSWKLCMKDGVWLKLEMRENDKVNGSYYLSSSSLKV